MSNITGQGWQLQIGTSAAASLPLPGSDTFTTVGDLEELKPPSPTREIDEFFTLDSVGARRLVGPVSWAAVTAKLVRRYGNAVHDSIETDAAVAGGQRRNWRIIASDTGAEQRDFVGFVNKFEIASVTNRGRVVVDIEITVDGNVTITR